MATEPLIPTMETEQDCKTTTTNWSEIPDSPPGDNDNNNDNNSRHDQERERPERRDRHANNSSSSSRRSRAGGSASGYASGSGYGSQGFSNRSLRHDSRHHSRRGQRMRRAPDDILYERKETAYRLLIDALRAYTNDVRTDLRAFTTDLVDTLAQYNNSMYTMFSTPYIFDGLVRIVVGYITTPTNNFLYRPSLRPVDVLREALAWSGCFGDRLYNDANSQCFGYTRPV